MAFVCPDCGGPLLTSMVNEERIDGCHRCGGAWFDDGELARLLPTASALATAERAYESQGEVSARGDGACPRCATALVWHGLRQAKTIRMRVCPSCRGVWAPEGTLGRLAASLSGQLPGASAAVMDSGTATVATPTAPAARVYVRRLHPAAEAAAALAVLWLVVALYARDPAFVPVAAMVSLILVARVPLQVASVTVDAEGLRLRTLLFGWRVPWRSYIWGYVRDPGTRDPRDSWHCSMSGRPSLSLTDLVALSDTSRGWGLSVLTRVILITWRGIYSFGGEFRDHDGLIDAIRRGIERS